MRGHESECYQCGMPEKLKKFPVSVQIKSAEAAGKATMSLQIYFHLNSFSDNQTTNNYTKTLPICDDICAFH